MELSGTDAAEVVIDMLELVQEEEGGRPEPGPLTTAARESLQPALTRLGHGWPGAARYARWFLVRGQYLDPGGPVVTLATRLHLALRPPHDRAGRRQLAVHGYQGAVRCGAVHAVADSGDPEELTWLRTRVERDPDPRVRATAMRVVAAGQHGDPGLLGWLRDRAFDQHADVRRGAVEVIAAAWREDPGTPDWLRARAFDQDDTVRRAAVEAVAAEGAGALAWIMARARDLSPRVRLAVVRAVAARAGDPGALRWLRERSGDQDGDVRMAAVRAVATHGAADPQTLPWLLARATTRPRSSIPLLEPEDTYGRWAGPGDDVRVAAIEAVASGWAGDPAVLTALRGWATDQHPAAREAAVAGLAAGWPAVFEAPAAARQPGDGPTGYWPSGTLPTAASTDLGALRNLATDPDAAPKVRRTAVRRLATDWRDDAGTPALLRGLAVDVPMYASSEVQAVASCATQHIAIGWPDHPGTVALLHEVIVCNPTTPAALAAVRALVAGWPDDAGTQPRLRDLAAEPARSPAGEGVRAAAVAALAATHRDDPGTFPLLNELLYCGSATVEVAAVRALAANWRDDPATVPLLREVLRTALGVSGSRDTGLAALEEIAVGRSGDPGTLRLLQDCATDLRARFTAVRGAVFRTLATGWPDDGVLAFLRERALAEADHERWTAARAVAVARPDDPGSLDLLRSCSRHEDWAVRCEVLTAVATAWPDEPGTLPTLHAATDDAHEWVQARALTAIAAGWPDHPQTLPLLRRRAEDGEHTRADTRMAALMAYVAVGPDDPGTLVWLSRLTPQVQRASDDRHRTSLS